MPMQITNRDFGQFNLKSEKCARSLGAVIIVLYRIQYWHKQSLLSFQKQLLVSAVKTKTLQNLIVGQTACCDNTLSVSHLIRECHLITSRSVVNQVIDKFDRVLVQSDVLRIVVIVYSFIIKKDFLWLFASGNFMLGFPNKIAREILKIIPFKEPF